MESEVLSCHRRTVVVSSWSTPCPSLVLTSSLSLRGFSGHEWLFGNHSDEKIKLVSHPLSGALSSVTILDPALALHLHHFPS